METPHEAPKVSVVIPTYNRADFISEAIESALAQTHRPIEIVIADDGSTDHTKDVLRKYESDIKYAFQPNGGLPSARNLGLKTATGDIIAYLDSDDLWPPDKLAYQVSILISDSSVDIVLGQLQYCIYQPGVTHPSQLEFISPPQLAYSLIAATIRRSAFDLVGKFDEQLRHSDDWDWFVRAKDMGLKIVTTPKVALYTRRHADNMSNERETGDRYTLRMLKKTLDRRRSQTQEKGKT